MKVDAVRPHSTTSERRHPMGIDLISLFFSKTYSGASSSVDVIVRPLITAFLSNPSMIRKLWATTRGYG